MKWKKSRHSNDYIKYVECSYCGHIQDYESNFCPSCGEKNNDIMDKKVFIVTYWDNGLEPVVTAFNNQVSAEKCYLYFKKEHDGCCMDEVPVYKHFGKQENNGADRGDRMRKPKLVIRKYKKMQKDRQEFRKEKSVEITNNCINLCQSCYKEYPNCDANNDDIVFGDGTGNDNICCCNKYLPLVERDTDRDGYK